MKKIFFVIGLTILLTYNSKSQTTDSTILKGFSFSNDLKIVEIRKQGVRTLLNKDPDIEAKLNKDKSFKTVIDITTPSFYKIGDLYVGHTIFIEPNDKIFISLKPIKKQPGKENLIFKEFRLTTTTKFYGNITYYDELESRIGVTIKYKFEKPEAYKSRCDQAYKIAIDLLNEYKTKNAISPAFYKYALEDLKARYVLWFCEMFFAKDKKTMSDTVLNDIIKMKFTDSTMFVSSDAYSIAPPVYNYYIANSFNPKNSYQNLDKEFASIQKNYTGFMKDRLMGWQLNDYIGKNHPAFDSCYQIFLSECKNTKIEREVKNKLTAYVKPVQQNVTDIDLNVLLSRTQIQNADNKILNLLNTVSDSSITLIDCWATWCMPCRAQIPYIEEFEKQYFTKLKVVYLSFDKDELKWKTFLAQNKSIGNQYLVSSNFSSEFSTYFNLETIPRYILLSKKGIKVLNDKMPLPALTEEFEIELKKYIQ